MPWIVPHGSDEDALYHHDASSHSSFPALNMGFHEVSCSHLRSLYATGKRILVYVASFSDLYGRDGEVRHMSVAYAVNEQGATYCMFDPASIGQNFGIKVLCPHPRVDSHAITQAFREAGWLIGRGPHSECPARYSEWAAIATTILVEGGATMTDLLGASLSFDVRALQSPERLGRAKQLQGVVIDSTVCPFLTLQPAVTAESREANSRALLSEVPWPVDKRMLARSPWRARALPDIDGAEFVLLEKLAIRAEISSDDLEIISHARGTAAAASFFEYSCGSAVADRTLAPGTARNVVLANYRPISLLNVFYKIYASLLQRRLAAAHDHHLRATLYGFRRSRSTNDPLFILHRAQDLAVKTGSSLQLLFLDWRMAFDKVDHKAMAIELERLGVHRQYVDIVVDMYNDPTFTVKGMHGEEVTATPRTGIRQGCPLSPYLFIMVMTVLFHDIDNRLLRHGVPTNSWSVGKPVYDIECADDTLLLAVTPPQLEELLRAVQVEASLYGMLLNPEKTELLIRPESPATIHFVNGQEVPSTPQAKYLGTQVSWTSVANLAIQARKTLAQAALHEITAPVEKSGQ